MKTLKILAIALIAASLTLTGCVTGNPNKAPVITTDAGGSVITNFPPAVVPNATAISNAVATAQSVIAATAPINPYAPLLSPLAGGIGAIALALSTLYARFKSNQASAAASTTATLAAAVNAVPVAKQVAMAHAANLGTLSTVLDALGSAPDIGTVQSAKPTS